MQKQIILSLALLLTYNPLTAEETSHVAATEQVTTAKAETIPAAEAEKATVATLRKIVVEAEDAKDKKNEEAPLTKEQEAKKRGVDYGAVKEINKPRGNGNN